MSITSTGSIGSGVAPALSAGQGVRGSRQLLGTLGFSSWAVEGDIRTPNISFQKEKWS